LLGGDIKLWSGLEKMFTSAKGRCELVVKQARLEPRCRSKLTPENRYWAGKNWSVYDMKIAVLKINIYCA